MTRTVDDKNERSNDKKRWSNAGIMGSSKSHLSTASCALYSYYRGLCSVSGDICTSRGKASLESGADFLFLAAVLWLTRIFFLFCSFFFLFHFNKDVFLAGWFCIA